MRKFKCWDKENETAEEAREIPALNEQMSAEFFADELYQAESFDVIPVMVEDEQGNISEWEVAVHLNPDFIANRVMP